MTTIGEALVHALEAREVEVVFGIPGVHTVELYRGLAGSAIRHVTARHEQGAGFMADGYARVSGKPGVAFVITGPGLTNCLTPMAQARADSVPMLVISGVNARATLGRQLGHLHELPDQRGMTALVARSSTRIEAEAGLMPALDHAFELFAHARGGPVHIEIPTDVMKLDHGAGARAPVPGQAPIPETEAIAAAARSLASAGKVVILAGGGAKHSDATLTALAERLDAPVIQTANARGLMHRHPLCVPASPCLEAVRDLIRDADVVLALGTEFGPTEYDMYQAGGVPEFRGLVRVDVSADQLARHPASHALRGKVEAVLPLLLDALGNRVASAAGAQRAESARAAARAEIGGAMRAQVDLLDTIRTAVPDAILVGDSTQPVYAGNLYYDHDRPGGWFNAATGYGALGYAIPAAIGAALADPGARVICITGDGGAQFTLPELMTAVDEKLPILFIIWNNHAYGEIASAMAEAGVTVIGCDPTPPDFGHIAAACAMPFQRCAMTPTALAEALKHAEVLTGPAMIEIVMD
ncbi:acetolactate synthase-1/2/3 large subunit [Hoeflea marina]|uniref:Acetolactate synthase-1/2/3 large subunit n=1 Tax=Hoeflea marina TaxID=274592 RepID=A0A317PKE1_9HYPH|nr:5-guanidino-2-oxopentanoate decarboxylase [Hoeflea marina]PWW01432.1 acetolactate synthase-1/2/3 large subunit [Hoeflea marina]